MPDTEYSKALKLGERAVKASLARGESPYLPALDEILKGFDIKSEVDLGIVEIPLDQIIGTKTAGRQNSFAINFMPIMEETSEFARKWEHVYDYQMDVGVGDPIEAFEFMNRFYVQEGNKRVSVLKYLHAFGIEGHVTRIVPKLTQDPQVKILYEFLEFYRRTQINYIWFTKEGSFRKLISACGMEDTDIWPDSAREDFSSRFQRFQKIFKDKSGEKLNITAGDAFLFYLSVYPYKDMDSTTTEQLTAQMDKIWKELAVLHTDPEQTLVMQPEENSSTAGLFTRFFGGAAGRTLNVAFIHERPMEESGWTYSHELGRMHLAQVFGSRVRTSSYFLGPNINDIDLVIESAIEDGNHILFITSERFVDASLKAALAHPQVRILNCCVNRPLRSIRTYYGRMYEAKFLEGLAAGAMAANDRIAFAADYPIYGSVSNINAFALGALATNPRAKIYLHWNCAKNTDFEKMISDNDIHVVADTDTIRIGSSNRRYGLYLTGNGITANLAAPIWNWGQFYEKIIRDILSGSWGGTKEGKSGVLNYWWGISGGIIDLITSNNLPTGLKNLVEMVRKEIYEENYHPFHDVILRQDGTSIGKAGSVLSPEQIITMDWLCSNVIGSIPRISDLTEDARGIVKAQGIYTNTSDLMTDSASVNKINSQNKFPEGQEGERGKEP